MKQVTSILMHICCAPCMIYPLKTLRARKIEVGGYFYNPNIHPQEEFALRKKNVYTYSNRQDCPVFFEEGYSPEEFFDAIGQETSFPERCEKCWYLRLKKTADHAKRIGINSFSTTLMVSPYQDKQLVKKAGEKAASEAGVEFFFEDFSVGYQDAVRISREEQLYRQKYCGCKYSLEERNKSLEDKTE